jgi:hypothetical protein
MNMTTTPDRARIDRGCTSVFSPRRMRLGPVVSPQPYAAGPAPRMTRASRQDAVGPKPWLRGGQGARHARVRRSGFDKAVIRPPNVNLPVDADALAPPIHPGLRSGIKNAADLGSRGFRRSASIMSR